ncbi:MAG: monovalent cation/H(+) antiporter subunit G [Agrobacterium albertimagni]|uniref:Monovalent cation/H+ antiporter subunit G n=1 Tax=Agrobacterium albertimagni AOL15 TaxID=1156935 RepID=K2QV40_9HYPH|nr:monovalent cation/H(+) antiporter subunit G [Agrobacterium albertimagni]EKF59072.1 monovalent cation/H+ antiporter subunit G [Agrobacterium albertimagni AOL15]
MTMPVADLPLWVVIAVSTFLLLGSGLTLLGAIGLLRLPTFYQRIHAPTLGTSWGTGAIMLASILYFSIVGSRAVLHEILIGVFVTLTTPVTLILLARAALHRDRAEGNDTVPSANPPQDQP